MNKVVVVGDTITLTRMLKADEWSIVQSLGLDFKVLDWLKLSTEQQALCMQYGVQSVSLTDAEVEDVFYLYQQDVVHGVGIEQYGALLYAIRHETFFASHDVLTTKLCPKYGMTQYWLLDNRKSLLPIYATHGINNLKTIAV